MTATMILSRNDENKFRIERVHRRHGAHRGSAWIVVVPHDVPFRVLLLRVASRWFVLLRVASCASVFWCEESWLTMALHYVPRCFAPQCGAPRFCSTAPWCHCLSVP